MERVGIVPFDQIEQKMSLWKTIKRQARLIQRTLNDSLNGRLQKIALVQTGGLPDWPARLSIAQPVLPGPTVHNKRHNIQLACERISRVVVQPGQIFSFWKTVGPPTAKRGFLPSRNIIGGRLSEDIGGGLCQVSGLLYLLSLRGGMQVLERHAHSVDIYREEERYAPLGADATVVYGYKDYRFLNPFQHPLMITFSMAEHSVTAHLSSPFMIVEQQIVFERHQTGGEEYVITKVITAHGEQILGMSRYQKLHTPE